LILDGTELAYLDHRALLSLTNCASSSTAFAVFRSHSTLPARLVKMLQFEDIRVEQIA
jgi:hypothetical protein